MTDHAEFTGYRDGILFTEEIQTGVQEPYRRTVAIRVCSRCGSLVADEDLHDVWHASQESPS